jgi:amidase
VNLSADERRDLMFRPALELAGLVHAGEISCSELVEASLARIEELDPQVNAFVEVDEDGVRSAASAIGPGDPRPFAGVPIAIKNNRAVRGLRLTDGTRRLRDHVAREDHHVVRRLRDAGFVIVGTTTLPEFGAMPVTEASLFGATRNPWDLSRTPGGSSGGSAAAVAAGMVPLAHGNDGGGSTRIPAACCGLVGLKAARGRISVAPDQGDSMLTIDGVLTRTVGDTAALLDVLAGYELGDATWAPPAQDTFAESAAEAPERLRVAATTISPYPRAELDPMSIGAVAEAIEVLRDLGHEVVEIDPDWQVDGLPHTFGTVFSIEIALGIAWSGTVTGRELTAPDMEPMSWGVYEMCRRMSALQGRMAVARLQQFGRRLVTTLAPYDALLTPVLAQRPLPVGALDTAAAEPMSTFSRSGCFAPYTSVANASGLPAISLPLLLGEDGLPLAVQLIGRPAGEGALLALAAQLEDARPWADRRPAVS